jgi:hypothetical protein
MQKQQQTHTLLPRKKKTLLNLKSFTYQEFMITLKNFQYRLFLDVKIFNLTVFFCCFEYQL